ncbi:MAG: hypothetical protein ACOCQ5_04145 [Halanaerobiales bacterium]
MAYWWLEFNIGNDWKAVEVMFQSEMTLVQFPRGSYRMMREGVAEIERYVMEAIGDIFEDFYKKLDGFAAEIN